MELPLSAIIMSKKAPQYRAGYLTLRDGSVVPRFKFYSPVPSSLSLSVICATDCNSNSFYSSIQDKSAGVIHMTVEKEANFLLMLFS